MQITAVELFGYAASAVIAYSLTRDSIVKLRWFNLFGASSFCIYGIIIGAFPVALLNGFIALTNIYYLRKLVTHTEQNFKLLKVDHPDNYIDFFLDEHRDEIDYLFPRFLKTAHIEQRQYFYLTEHTNVVGVLAGIEDENGGFVVDFDFVVPAYRDCRLGQYALGQGQALKKQFGYTQIGAKADSMEHEQFLADIGMSPKAKGVWTYDGHA